MPVAKLSNDTDMYARSSALKDIEETLHRSLSPIRHSCSGCTKGIPYAYYPIVHSVVFDNSGTMLLVFDPRYTGDVEAAVRALGITASPLDVDSSSQGTISAGDLETVVSATQ